MFAPPAEPAKQRGIPAELRRLAELRKSGAEMAKKSAGHLAVFGHGGGP
jgi:hypothetical protein